MKHLKHLALLLATLFLAWRGEMVVPGAGQLAIYFGGILGIFFLIATVEVLLPPERVAHLLGRDTGLRGILSALFIGSTMVGGAPMLLPAARLLRKRGAGAMNVTLVVGGAGVVRLSLLFFEARSLGLPATLLRLSVTLGFLLITAYLVERWNLLNR
jgi:uncharacterized membrane protein YraQ (UPF0718 family)